MCFSKPKMPDIKPNPPAPPPETQPEIKLGGKDMGNETKKKTAKRLGKKALTINIGSTGDGAGLGGG